MIKLTKIVVASLLIAYAYSMLGIAIKESSMAFGISLPHISNPFSHPAGSPQNPVKDVPMMPAGATVPPNNFNLSLTQGTGGAYTPPAPVASSGSAAPDYTAAQLAGIDGQLGRLDGQRDIGLGSINQGYQSALDQLINGKNQAQGSYNTNRTQSMQDNQTAKGNIDNGIHQTVNALQRLFGVRGAGSSSAAQIAAPYAAGLQGNQQRQQVSQAYDRNMGALDTGWANYQTDWNQSKGALDTDKTSRTNSLLQNLANTRAQLLASKQAVLGGTSLQPQIDALGRQADALGAVQTFDPGQVNYATPNLDSYNYSQSGGPQLGTSSSDPSQTALGAYYTLLGGADKKKQGALV